MKITILGCGCSGGTPLIGNVWGACDPHNEKNRRLRVSLLLEGGGKGETLLFDTSPDMREQLLRADVKDISAVLYTHAHADHAHGIDNIRSINWLTGNTLPLYADAQTLTELRSIFGYIFDYTPDKPHHFTRPAVDVYEIIDGQRLTFGSLNVTSFHQAHGRTHSRGYRINDFGYSTDASDLDDAAFESLRGVKVWVLGAVREREHPTHAHIERALEWIARVKPERAILTHMDHTLDYETLRAKLPPNVEPAYDGLTFEV